MGKKYTEDEIEDMKCELIDYFEEFMDEPFEEAYEDISDEDVVKMYKKLFIDSDKQDKKIIKEWLDEYK